MPMTVVTTGIVTMLPSGAPLSEIVPSLISVALTPTSVAPPLSVVWFPVPATALPAPGAGVAGALGVPGFGAPGVPGTGAADGVADAADLAAGVPGLVAAAAEAVPVPVAAGAAAVAPAV